MREGRSQQTVSCAIVGYGGMAKYHGELIGKVKELRLVAACDIDSARCQAAQEDFPQIQAFTSLEKMLRWGEFDLAIVVTPHNTHARLAIQCLKAGKHVVVEKPMCITAKEASNMIQAAKQSGVMLSVFHNRRWDGDFLTMKDIINKGLIGEVFHVETGMGNYGHPLYWWRSDKRISGGALYDWGAHLVDWVLGLVPGKVKNVTGFSHKRVWHDVTNEDEVEAVILFESGAMADVQMSSIARVGRPKWRILGEKGGILVDNPETVKVFTEVQGIPAQIEIKNCPRNWDAYYPNISAHLLKGEPLAVTPESSRRVIAVIEAAGKSARLGQAVPVPHE